MKSYHDIASDGGSDVAGQLADQAERMRARMSDVRHVVAVMSGKGGVGKSTLAVNLAAALAEDGGAVGIVDGDINGPSIGRIAGADTYELTTSDVGIEPARGYAGLRIMSMSLFLAGETSPVVWDAPTQEKGFAWRGLREAGALRSLISDTNWGTLDYLVVDLPPGSEKLANLVDVLPQLSGALAVTIPSAVSAAAVGKSVRMARRHLHAGMIGLVENMATYLCPTCGETERLFPEGSTERLANELDIPIIGRVPFDPHLAVTSDAGRSYLASYADRPAAAAIRDLAHRVAQILRKNSTDDDDGSQPSENIPSTLPHPESP